MINITLLCFCFKILQISFGFEITASIIKNYYYSFDLLCLEPIEARETEEKNKNIT